MYKIMTSSENLIFAHLQWCNLLLQYVCFLLAKKQFICIQRTKPYTFWVHITNIKRSKCTCKRKYIKAATVLFELFAKCNKTCLYTCRFTFMDIEFWHYNDLSCTNKRFSVYYFPWDQNYIFFQKLSSIFSIIKPQFFLSE